MRLRPDLARRRLCAHRFSSTSPQLQRNAQWSAHLSLIMRISDRGTFLRWETGPTAPVRIESTVSFGCGSCSMQNRGMLTTSNTHICFVELPIEAVVLFYFQSMSAWEYHCNWPHTSAEICRDLERIWNARNSLKRTCRTGPVCPSFWRRTSASASRRKGAKSSPH
jgi:hypothetical protein